MITRRSHTATATNETKKMKNKFYIVSTNWTTGKTRTVVGSRTSDLMGAIGAATAMYHKHGTSHDYGVMEDKGKGRVNVTRWDT
jgi:hypothetical protein